VGWGAAQVGGEKQADRSGKIFLMGGNSGYLENSPINS